MRYFHKTLVSRKFYRRNGQWIEWTILPGDRGILATEDDGLLTDLVSSINRHIGGISEIAEDEYQTLLDGLDPETVRMREMVDVLSQRFGRTFYHSGNLGDIVYAMPTIKALGGGALVLGPKLNVRIRAHTHTPMTQERTEFLKPLLLAQDYVKAVEFSEKAPTVDYNLNRFWEYCRMRTELRKPEFHARKLYLSPDYKTANLSLMHQFVFGLVDKNNWQGVEEQEPWLKVSEPIVDPAHPIVIHRSRRYRNPAFPWRAFAREHRMKMMMVGLPDEHRDFQRHFGGVEFRQASDALELARIIAGAKLFMGNQSFPYAIAEGLKKRTMQETCLVDPNCIFNRPEALHCKHGHVTIPPEWLL